MKNTLLDDLINVYNSMKCDPLPKNEFNRCFYCQNKHICGKILNLINSITDYYGEE